MGNPVDHDASNMVVNGVEHSIAAKPQTIGVGRSPEFFSVEGSRIIRERFNSVLDFQDRFAGKAAQLASGSRGIENVIQRQAVSGKRGLSPSE